MQSPTGAVLPRVTMVILTLTGAVVVLIGMKQFGEILGPLLLTVNLFIAAYPIQTALTRVGVPRVIAQVVLALTVFAILAAFFYALTWSLVALVVELPSHQARFWTLYQQVVDLLADFGLTESQMLAQLQQISPANFAGFVQSVLGQATNFLTLVSVIVVMVFMMAFDSDTFGARDAVLRRHQPRIWASLVDFTHGVRRYWVVSTIFGLIVAAIDVVALLWLGVPLAMVWGILAFLSNYIPNVGFVIGLVPPVIMALLANDALTALLVIVIYSVVNFVIQSIIQPKFNGEAVGITALVAFLSLLLWSAVLGAMGALLALPMTLLAKTVLIDHDPRMRWLNAFLSNDPHTAEPNDPLTAESRDAPGVPPEAVTDH